MKKNYLIQKLHEFETRSEKIQDKISKAEHQIEQAGFAKDKLNEEIKEVFGICDGECLNALVMIETIMKIKESE